MAAKLTAKQKREQQNDRKMQKVKQNAEIREEQAKKKAEEDRILKEETRIQKERAQFDRYVLAAETEEPKLQKVSKSQAKAAGLKSTFVLDERTLLMTSFGRGNDAVREKHIENNGIGDISDAPSLNVKIDDPGFEVSGRIVEGAHEDNPFQSVKAPGLDQLQMKSKLEQMYFGRTFKDNIHIQLIYSILDIEKILSVHVNNIVFQINNVFRKDEMEHFDLIGNLLEENYDKFISKPDRENVQLFNEFITTPQTGYFGKQFLPLDSAGKKLKDTELDEHKKKCYYLLSALGILRQATAHGGEKTRAKMFKLDAYPGVQDSEYVKNIRAALDNLYMTRVQELNRNFLSTSGKNLEILWKVYNGGDYRRENLCRDYYDFVVRKDYKNLGFSVKKLREMILAFHAQELSDHDYDSVRTKLNSTLDFMIWRYYQQEENTEHALQFIEMLRSTRKDSLKEAYYRQEAAKVWEKIEEPVRKHVIPQMDGNVIKDMAGMMVTAEMIGDNMVPEHAHAFSEAMYLLTIFLDGKEINDLLTQLISKFEIIQSFYDVMKEEGIRAEFAPNYRMFAESGTISKELRVINSFARMSKEDPSVKPVLFMEAAEILGYKTRDGRSLEEVVENIFDKENRPKDERGKRDNNFRNFIINNVIESTRFKYLVRYGNPAKIRKLAENENVVRFVLNDIPDEQIRLYYNSCNGTEKVFNPDMRENLVAKITGLSFMDFADVHQGKSDDVREIEDKERKKSLVRLYLTVMYILLKNLVYVNSRYYLAFHCAERDGMVWDPAKYNDSKIKNERAAFARDWVNSVSTNKKAKSYIALNISNSDDWTLRTFRNCAEHLNVIRSADLYIGDIREFSSYFELYHYILQRCIMAQYEYDSTHIGRVSGALIISDAEMTGKTLYYFELVRKYHAYCKDFVKAMNVPFAYNLARYKNLSINELFDRNNYMPDKESGLEPTEQ